MNWNEWAAMLVSWGPGRSSLESKMPQMSGWQSNSSELITPSIPLSNSDRWRREQLGMRWLLRVASLMISLQLLHRDWRYIWVSKFFVWIFVGVEASVSMSHPHGAGASIPLLRFCTPWKAYKAASYLCVGLRTSRPGAVIAQILAFFASIHSICPSRLSAPRAYVIYGELTLPIYECA